MDERSDERLVRAAQSADRSAYAALVDRHYKDVFLVCLGVLADTHDAEDIAQDAMLRGFERIRTLRDGSQFGPWITRVAKNLCINLLRRRQCGRKALTEQAPQQAPRPTHDDTLQHAIGRLPEKMRLPLVMYYFDGRDVKAVADKLGLSASAVYLRLRTAIRQLHELMSEQGETT